MNVNRLIGYFLIIYEVNAEIPHFGSLHAILYSEFIYHKGVKKTTVGIDKTGFFVPPYYIDMTALAEARNIDPGKFHIGIGQNQMTVNPISQDIMTFTANAAEAVLIKEDKEAIDMVIVGTESSIDDSKAATVVLHRLMGIRPFARSFEIKETCYGATAGLRLAKSHVALHPDKKILVVVTNIAKYGLNSGNGPTQEAGAVAMLVASEPRILALKGDNVMLTQDIYDFWRPTGHPYPMVGGPLSNETYIQSFAQVWDEHKKRTGLDFADYDTLAFHIPYTKMGRKVLLARVSDQTKTEQEQILARYEESIVYSRRVGNLYTDSLCLGLISLLGNATILTAGNQIGLLSYGSGAVAEFFTGELVAGYQNHLQKGVHLTLLDNRIELSITEYEAMFAETLDADIDQTLEDELRYSIPAVSNTARSYRN